MSYEDLKPFRGDHGYSKEIMDQTFQGIYDNIFVCDFISADTYYVKLIPWCDYVKRRIEATKAIPYNPEKYLREEPFDRIFNDLPDYAYTTHVLIMSMLFFVGIGFIGNLLCLYWFNSNSNRSGATLYLTFAVIFDLLYLSGFTILYPYQLSSPNITEQFNRYQNYTLHLIPRFKPCVESSSLISLWLVIALLIDRLPIAAETISPHTETLLDPKIRESVNRGRSRCRYSIHMIIILFFFTIYTVLKSFSYYIAKYHRYNNLKIENMLLSQNFFKIALNYVMRPIIEILLPGLLIVWYLVLIRDKKYGFKKLQSFKKKNIQIENERITNQTSGLSNYEIVTDYNTTARTNAMMNMSILDCKRWRNEFIVSKMTVNIALFYLFYLIFQTIIYFIWIDVKTDRVTNLIFTYINVVSTTVIISLKPFVYLFSNKTVIKEFHKIQKSNLYSVNPTSGWHRSRKSASQDSDRILK